MSFVRRQNLAIIKKCNIHLLLDLEISLLGYVCMNPQECIKKMFIVTLLVIARKLGVTLFPFSRGLVK